MAVVVNQNKTEDASMRLSTVVKMAAVAAALSVAAAQAADRLQGAGATFPQPFYQRLVAEYQKLSGVKIDYQGIGSGGGLKGLAEKTVDFAGSDAPMDKKMIQKCGGADNIVEVPSCAGGIVPIYNVPDVKQELRFTGPVLADIYLGKIRRWNDPELAKLNPDIDLPDLAITPAWRTDGSGTNFVWTHYLCTQSNEFKSTIGAGLKVQWPVGLGGPKNQGVTAKVQQTAGGIGYVEQSYADQNHIPYGSVQNKAGKFVKAAPKTVSLAGAAAVDQMRGHMLPANIWNQSGEQAYPIASFTYLILYRDLNNLADKQSAQSLVDFLWWIVHDGQKFAADLDYAPLDPAVQKKVEEALKTITYKGESLKIGG
jgi:phosphate transport system substrate-binding protein